MFAYVSKTQTLKAHLTITNLIHGLVNKHIQNYTRNLSVKTAFTMTEIRSNGINTPPLSSPRILRPVSSRGALDKPSKLGSQQSPTALLKCLDDVIVRTGPLTAPGKENKSPEKLGKLSVSESELYKTGCDCLQSLWELESRKAVKGSEIDRRQLQLIQKLASGSEVEVGFAFEQIVVLFKRLFRRIGVEHEAFNHSQNDSLRLARLLVVDIPPRKTIAAVVNIVVALHLAMLKGFCRVGAKENVIEVSTGMGMGMGMNLPTELLLTQALVASLKHPEGPVVWVNRTAATHQQAKLTTLSKLTAALSKLSSNKLDSMKLQLVSMECSSDMSQMDLLTDTVQKMTDANISETERSGVISDLLKYLGGLDNEVSICCDEEPAEIVASVSIVEALTDSGSFSEEFSLPTLLRAVKATDNKQMASPATLSAIEGFFKNTHKKIGGGETTEDHIRAMTSLLQLLTTGVQNLNIKKALPTLCDYASAVLKSSATTAAATTSTHGCFVAIGDAFMELKDAPKLVLLSNLVYNLGAKSPSSLALVKLSTTLHKPAGVSEQYLLKCSKVATMMCEAKQWQDAVTHCGSVLSSLKDATILSGDAVVAKFVRLLAFPLLNLENQAFTFPELSDRPLCQAKLVQLLMDVVGVSSRLKNGVLDELFRFQCDVLSGGSMWLELVRLLGNNLADCLLVDVSTDVLKELLSAGIEASPVLEFHLLGLATVYLGNGDHLERLTELVNEIKPEKEDLPILRLISRYFSCQALHSLELKLHKHDNDSLRLAQCYLNLGDVQKCKLALRDIATDSSLLPDQLLLLHTISADYMCLDGQVEAAQKRLAKHTQLVSSNEVLARALRLGKAEAESPRDFCLRLTAQARFWLCQSRVSFESGHLEHSAALAKKAVALTQAYIKRGAMTYSGLPSYAWDMLVLNLSASVWVTSVLIHLGIWRDAEQVIMSAIKIHASVGHPLRLASAQSLHGWLLLKKDDLAASETTLATACDTRELYAFEDAEKAILCTRVGLFHSKIGQLEEGNLQYEKATQMITTLSDPSGLARDMSQLRVERRKKPAAPTAAVLPGFKRVFGQVERARTELLLLADEKPAKLPVSGPGKWDMLLDQVLETRAALHSAKRLLGADAIFLGLEESALSIPSASSCDVSLHPNSNVQAAHQMLVAARKTLSERIEELMGRCSSIEITEALHLLSSLDVFVGALGTGETSTWLEIPRDIARVRQQRVAQISIGEWDSATEGVALPAVSTDIKGMLVNLPDSWNVVSLTVCPSSGDLVVSQYSASSEPFLLRLPLHRHNSRDVDEHPFLFSDGIEELERIILESDTMTRAGAGPGGSEEWWATRHELDGRLKQLLHDAEFCWLGGFMGIFSDKRVRGESFTRPFNRILSKHLPSRTSTQRGRHKGKKVDINARVLSLFLGLGTDVAPELLEDLVYFVLDILQFHGEYNAYDELDTDQIFVEIEEAIGAYHADNQEARFSHTVLVVDKQTQQFPWESMSMLRGRSVSRVPSIKVLGELLDSPEPSGSPYYVLNPSGDLPKTQERFEEVLSSFEGVIGRPPSEAEWEKALKTSSAFIYMGHGGGDKYIRNSTIAKMSNVCPTVLLGCSSGVVRQAGEFEPWGIPLAYLSAGCPSLVANLWDVTDKDIDKFGRQFLTRWGVIEEGGSEESVNSSVALAQSRNDCLLRFLNGAAPVLYGIPTDYKH